MDICPLSGQPCDQPRTTHVTEIKDGQVFELHLCQKCSAEYAPQEPEKEPPPVPVEPKLSEAMLAFLQLLLGGPMAPKYKKRNKNPCPQCGHTIEDVLKTGRFGCEHCYEFFKGEASMIMSRYQEGIKHVGKVPKCWKEREDKRKAEEAAAQEQSQDKADIEDQIGMLKLKMAKAVETENYEVAGVLKKKIEELQQRLPNKDVT